MIKQCRKVVMVSINGHSVVHGGHRRWCSEGGSGDVMNEVMNQM